MSDIDLIARQDARDVGARVSKLESNGFFASAVIFVYMVAAWFALFFVEISPLAYRQLRDVDKESPMFERINEAMADGKITIIEWMSICTRKAYDHEKSELRKRLDE